MATQKHEALEETPKSENVKKTKTLGDGKASIAGSVFNLANAVCINTYIPFSQFFITLHLTSFLCFPFFAPNKRNHGVFIC